MKLWTGRFSKEIDPKTNDFNSSIKFDSRMYKEDITGSIAHAAMLAQALTSGIIFSLILLTNSGEISTSYRLLICSAMSRWLMPQA